MKKIYFLPVAAIVSFLMYSCGSNPSSSDTSNAPASAAKGEAIYKRACVTCHLPNGEGLPNTYPPLAKSDFINDKEKTIGIVAKGYSGELVVNGIKYNSSMPAQQLTDNEVASVLMYVYANFGNNGSPVTIDDVKAAKAKL